MLGAYEEREGKERTDRRRKEGRGRMTEYPQIYIYDQNPIRRLMIST